MEGRKNGKRSAHLLTVSDQTHHYDCENGLRDAQREGKVERHRVLRASSNRGVAESMLKQLCLSKCPECSNCPESDEEGQAKRMSLSNRVKLGCLSTRSERNVTERVRSASARKQDLGTSHVAHLRSLYMISLG